MKAPMKSPAEFEALMQRTAQMQRPAMYRLLLILTFRLGLRPIELAQLESSHFRSGELRIRNGHTKGGKGRSLPTSPEIMEALALHMQGREGVVFLNKEGLPFQKGGITEACRRLYKLSGQVGSAYSGRRTLLTEMVERNVNILTVQAVAGHRSPQTTISYVGVSPTMMARALFGEDHSS